MTENQFIQTAYNNDSIKDCIPPRKEFSGAVLASP